MLYRNFSNQDEIDREYNPRLRVEQTDQYLTKYLSESERVSKTLNHQDGIQYGPTLNEVLDYYPSSEAQAPLVVSFMEDTGMLFRAGILLLLRKHCISRDFPLHTSITAYALR